MKTYWRQADGPKPVTYEVDANGCHACTSDGYSRGYPVRNVVRAGVRKLVKLSRIVWERANGPIPEGQVMRHLCHNKACVNLAHLAIGTVADNARDSALVGKNSSPLTVEQAAAIRRAATFSEAVRIAAACGIKKKSVGSIRSGRTWKHLPIPPSGPDPSPPAPTMTGAELREVRRARGVSIYEMADMLGCDYTAVSRYESGSRRFSPELQERYLAAVEAVRPKSFCRGGHGIRAEWGPVRQRLEARRIQARGRKSQAVPA